jgi:hypothetical protein
MGKAMNLDLMRAKENGGKISTFFFVPPVNASDYVTRRFDPSSAGLKSPWGWTFAGTPLDAISRSNWSPEPGEVRRQEVLAPYQGGSRFLHRTGRH